MPHFFSNISFSDYSNLIDWNNDVVLEEEFTVQTQYDAFNRPTLITQPDNTVVMNKYDKGGMLQKVLYGNTEHISNIVYNAKGQREHIYYGNNTKISYYYNSKNFRLERLLTTRNNGQVLQDLNYTFDAVGNIVEQVDDAPTLK